MTTPAAAASKPAGNRFTRFFTGIWAEMKKVVWLSRREVTYLTLLVLGVTVVVGIILYGFDFGFSTLVDKLLLK
jgi:preprotein translocase subunit SecE